MTFATLHSRKLPVGALSFSLGVIFYATPLFGQTPPTSALSPTKQIENIEVLAKRVSSGAATLSLDAPAAAASRLGITNRETPASVDVIDRETFLQRGQLSVREAVQSATGVTYIGTGGNGNSALSMRGFTGHGSVMHLLDGTRIFVGSGTVTLAGDTWPFERVEVLRGPASVLFGDSAIGGAINYVTKKPSFQRSSEALFSLGRNSTSQVAFGSTGAVSESVAYRADISRQSSNGYVKNAEYERYTFSGSVLFQPSPQFSLTLALDSLRNDDARFWGTPAINGVINESIRRENYNVSDSTIRYEDDFLRAKLNWNIHPTLTLKNELYYYQSDRHWRNLENYTFQPATNLIRRTSYLEIFHDLKQSGNRLEAIWRPSTLPVRLVTGIELNRVDFKNTNNSPFTGTSDVALTGFDRGQFLNSAGTRLGANSVADQRSLFAESLITASRTFKLVLGARTENYQVDSRNNQTGLRAEKSFSPTTWRIGGVWEAVPNLSLYAQTSTGVDPIAGLLTLSPTNATFDLAKGRQHEVGLKQSFGNGLGDWTMAFYEIEKSNLLSRDPVNPTITQQIGSQSSRGVELALAIRPGNGWQIEANIALLRAKFDRFDELVSGRRVSRAGNLPPNVAERVANVWLTKAWGIHWRAGVGFRSVGRRFANNANTIIMPAYQTAEASINWKYSAKWQLTLRGRNLTDKTYLVSPYNSGNQFYLGEPRALEISARFNF